MIPGTFVLRLRRGDYYRKKFRFRDDQNAYLDFAGLTGAAQVRETADSVSVMAEATVTMGTDATGPYVQVYFPSATTAAMTGGEYFWDLQITDATGALTWLEGAAIVTKDITRAA